jgi:hypothetical protein
MGGWPFKKGAMTPLLRKKGVPDKKKILKCTDQVFLRYWFGKYQEIPTEYQPKIPNRYTTLTKTYLSRPKIPEKYSTSSTGTKCKNIPYRLGFTQQLMCANGTV